MVKRFLWNRGGGEWISRLFSRKKKRRAPVVCACVYTYIHPKMFQYQARCGFREYGAEKAERRGTRRESDRRVWVCSGIGKER